MKKGIKNIKKQQKDQERSFVERWSPHEAKRDYDALEDPHAKSYFYNKSMSQHLKGLRRVNSQ